MGERIAVKPGSSFERTSSQKRQLALQTENSTVGISLFEGMSSSDAAMLGLESSHNRSQSEVSLDGVNSSVSLQLPSAVDSVQGHHQDATYLQQPASTHESRVAQASVADQSGEVKRWH